MDERRDRIRVTRSEGTSQGELTIVAEGAPIIKNWIDVNHRIIKEGLGHIPDPLELVTIPLDDGVLRVPTARVSYEQRDLAYTISAAIVLSITQEHPRNRRRSSGLDIRALIGPSSEFQDPPFSLEDIKNSLEFRLESDSCNVDLDDENLVIKGDNGEYRLAFHNHPLQGPYYIFSLDGDPEETLEQFGLRYEEFAQLLKQTINTFYALKRETLPAGVFRLAPPNNTAPLTANLERALKRTMTADGLMDDDRLVEDIMQRIALGNIADVNFGDIGGQKVAKEELETIVYSLTNPEAFTEEGTKPPRGILLYGPPGTGKTLLSKALAREANANIYIVRLSDVIHHLYGKSERLVSAIFDQARANAPVVILFDEIDALASQRQYSTEATSRIVSVLLTEMDGLEEHAANVVVVGATNRLDAIDPALLRPGRFDLLVEVKLPDDEERAEILKIKIDQALELAQGKELFDADLDFNLLVKKTAGLSGADIEEVIRRVLVKNVKLKMRGEAATLVTTSRLIEEIESYEHVAKAKRSIGFPTNGTREL